MTRLREDTRDIGVVKPQNGLRKAGEEGRMMRQRHLGPGRSYTLTEQEQKSNPKELQEDASETKPNAIWT